MQLDIKVLRDKLAKRMLSHTNDKNYEYRMFSNLTDHQRQVFVVGR